MKILWTTRVQSHEEPEKVSSEGEGRENRRRVDRLLRLETLTDDDLYSFLQERDSGPESEPVSSDGKSIYLDQLLRYRDRRREMDRLSSLLSEGRARIDADGRLLPLPEDDEGQGDGDEHDNNQNLGNLAQDPEPPNNIFLFDPLMEDVNEENDHAEFHDQFLRQQQQDASQSIQRVLQNRYKHVPRHKLQLIAITPGPPSRRRGRLTLRRICCAVFAVVAAFVAIMIQSLPSEPESQRRKRTLVTVLQTQQSTLQSEAPEVAVFSLDVLLQAVAKVRLPHQHIKVCHDLSNRNKPSPWSFPWTRDCSNGVLLVPSIPLHVLKSTDEAVFKRDCSWNQVPPSCFASSATTPITRDGQCPSSVHIPCFRGVHDDLITKEQVATIISVGKSILRSNTTADHFDIHYETDSLPSSILYILHDLLTSTYHLTFSIKPIAFRIHAAAPQNGDTSFYTRSGTMTQHPLMRLLNRKRYAQWVSKRHNHPATTWPWSFFTGNDASQSRDAHDTCRVMADLHADDRFQVLTSIYLTEDYSGGSLLFVDDASRSVESLRSSIWRWLWRRNSRRKGQSIQRGLAVDGRVGRVVVSSGDNRRCHLPVRQGIRAVLQIWWSCD